MVGSGRRSMYAQARARIADGTDPGGRGDRHPVLRSPGGSDDHQGPKVDGTDFYMFRSYEPGRTGFVTLLANYYPLQDTYGGPNFFQLDPDAVYEIHVDNTADGREDLTF